MNVLIVGGNGNLGAALINKFIAEGANIEATSRNPELLKTCFEQSIIARRLDFGSHETIKHFFEQSGDFQQFDVILLCASPWEGTLSDSTFDDLDIWSNAHNVALKLAKLAIDKLDASGKLIFIGSVVGMPNHIASSHVPYSVYKGALSLLAEGFHRESGKSATYINLGGFINEVSEQYLQTNDVADAILKSANHSDGFTRIDVMSKADKKKYLT